MKSGKRENPRTNDTKLEEDILGLVSVNTLLLLDRGFDHFSFWLQLIEPKIHFITPLKKGASIKVEKVFSDSYSLRDRLIVLGSGTKRTPLVRVRLVEVRSGKTWHSYVTSVLEPTILPPYVVADLYRKRCIGHKLRKSEQSQENLIIVQNLERIGS